MATTDVTPQPKVQDGSAAPHQPVINDFSIQVATVNGSGSQSSNSVLLRSIFMMGIPVSGKNLFPSNIAGLPTWFTIRANKHGWVARKKEIDILIAMNPETRNEIGKCQSSLRSNASDAVQIEKRKTGTQRNHARPEMTMIDQGRLTARRRARTRRTGSGSPPECNVLKTGPMERTWRNQTNMAAG